MLINSACIDAKFWITSRPESLDNVDISFILFLLAAQKQVFFDASKNTIHCAIKQVKTGETAIIKYFPH
ncbi:hypothetical protein PMM47T1_17320 [Pseudomonas sp. M47T1]|nr:hypothetical protein PMM47T1_17320 [Pseudomonas sp. M47T1]